MPEPTENDAVINQRRDEALRRALNTPPKLKPIQNAPKRKQPASPAKAQKPARPAEAS